MADQYNRLLKMANTLQKEIDRRSGPRLENTPKRVAQAASNRIELAVARRAQRLMRTAARVLVGEIPCEHVDFIRTVKTKADFQRLARRRLKPVPNGYHGYHVETGEWSHAGTEAENELRRLADCDAVQRTVEDEIADKLAALRFSNIDGFFPTPKALADEMAELLDARPGSRILEPSAGAGHLADAVMRNQPDCQVDCIEPVPSLCEVLELKGHSYTQGRLEELETDPIYDGVIMNPPYERRTDILHVLYCYDLLKPGGRLVALVTPAYEFTDKEKATILRQIVANHGYALDKGQPFKGADAFRQTGVNVRLLVLDKPPVESETLITDDCPIFDQTNVVAAEPIESKTVNVSATMAKLLELSSAVARLRTAIRKRKGRVQ